MVGFARVADDGAVRGGYFFVNLGEKKNRILEGLELFFSWFDIDFGCYLFFFFSFLCLISRGMGLVLFPLDVHTPPPPVFCFLF